MTTQELFDKARHIWPDDEGCSAVEVLKAIHDIAYPDDDDLTFDSWSDAKERLTSFEHATSESDALLYLHELVLTACITGRDLVDRYVPVLPGVKFLVPNYVKYRIATHYKNPSQKIISAGGETLAIVHQSQADTWCQKHHDKLIAEQFNINKDRILGK